MKKFLTLIVLSLLLSSCARLPGKYDQLASCLTEKGLKMYGSIRSSHCKVQEKDFQGSFDLIDFVECTEHPMRCNQANVEVYPTWVLDGTSYEGRRSLSELAQISGCEL